MLHYDHYQNGDYRNIPKKVFLIPADHAELLRIWSRAVLDWGAASADSQLKAYRGYYTGLMRSLALARSDSQLRYVNRTYCSRLRQKHAALSAGDRDLLKTDYWGDAGRTDDRPAQYDHHEQVETFCARKP
jgi:hypothetical protein